MFKVFQSWYHRKTVQRPAAPQRAGRQGDVLLPLRLEHLVSLQNVSFSLSPGKVTALVGPSGSGKSSCVNILENFYPLQGGRVLLDGKPIGAYDHKYLHRVVSTTCQSVPTPFPFLQ